MEHRRVVIFHKVSFDLTKQTVVISDNYRRRLSSSYYRDLPKRCSESQDKIYDILNNITNGSFLPLNEGDNLKVFNPSMMWDEDESPIDLLEFIKTEPDIIIKVLNKLTINRRPSKSHKVTISLNDVVVFKKGKPFQSFLTVRISEKVIPTHIDRNLLTCLIKGTDQNKIVKAPEFDDLISSIDNFSLSYDPFMINHY